MFYVRCICGDWGDSNLCRELAIANGCRDFHTDIEARNVDTYEFVSIFDDPFTAGAFAEVANDLAWIVVSFQGDESVDWQDVGTGYDLDPPTVEVVRDSTSNAMQVALLAYMGMLMNRVAFYIDKDPTNRYDLECGGHALVEFTHFAMLVHLLDHKIGYQLINWVRSHC